jgi:predicted transcriptional regulator
MTAGAGKPLFGLQASWQAAKTTKSGSRRAAHIFETLDRRMKRTGLRCVWQIDCPGIPSMSASVPIELAAEIVAAFVSNNPLPKSDLPALIHSMHAAIVSLSMEASAPPQIEAKEPAVPIRKSITPDFLICLEDGKRFKSLRRHLGTLGLTPHQYREKWKLPSDYPMVAPNYAAQRSAMAKKIGLGRTRSPGPSHPRVVS